MPAIQPEVQPYMTPTLKKMGKSLWVSVLASLDGEEVNAIDYVMLSTLCHSVDQLNDYNEAISKKPYTIVEGMIKANPLSWNAQSLIKSIALLSDKLGINRAMRKDGNDTVPRDLLAFIRGESNGEAE